MDAALVPLRADEPTMKTFTLIRSYSCRKSLGFVYDLDGKRCASLARSMNDLMTKLGAEESGSVVEKTVAELAVMTGESEAEIASILREMSGRKAVAARETVRIIKAGPGAHNTLTSRTLHIIDASGYAHCITNGMCKSDMGFNWIMG